jgi:NADH:ubiquinone oxidoreductase subunit B-like Fe-S oxidoreductase
MKPEHQEILDEAEDLVLELSSSGKDKEAIAAAVAQFLDAILPLDVLIPNPIGTLAEQNDEAVFKALVSQLMRVFHADPAKKAERKQRRQQRRAERKQRRESKRAKETNNAR